MFRAWLRSLTKHVLQQSLSPNIKKKIALTQNSQVNKSFSRRSDCHGSIKALHRTMCCVRLFCAVRRQWADPTTIISRARLPDQTQCRHKCSTRYPRVAQWSVEEVGESLLSCAFSPAGIAGWETRRHRRRHATKKDESVAAYRTHRMYEGKSLTVFSAFFSQPLLCCCLKLKRNGKRRLNMVDYGPRNVKWVQLGQSDKQSWEIGSPKKGIICWLVCRMFLGSLWIV